MLNDLAPALALSVALSQKIDMTTRPHNIPAGDLDEVYGTFKDVVNMTAHQIETWLETEESREVGQKKEGGESVGHQSGRHIITILGKKKAELTDVDYVHMRKVNGYVKRHLAQRPHEVDHSSWRYSLMNWGHDPLK